MATLTFDNSRSSGYTLRMQVATAGAPGAVVVAGTDVLIACKPGTLKNYLSRLPLDSWAQISAPGNNFIEIIPVAMFGVCNPAGITVFGSANAGVATLMAVSTTIDADSLFIMRFNHSLNR